MRAQSLFIAFAVASGVGANWLPYQRSALSSGPPSNLAAGSFSNCTSYATVETGDTCSTLEAAADISFSDLLRWNPELDTACTILELGAAYCVGGGGDACPQLYTVVSGDYCSKIESEEGLTAAQLQALNPWLDASCDLEVGEVLCVGSSPTPTTTLTMTVSTATTATTTTTSAVPTPTNIASGSWTNCTTYYEVKSGDSCTAIDEQFGIALSDFLRWNPEVSDDCSNLLLAAYCVKGSPACDEVYTVVSGDYCAKIEYNYNITDADLYALNPWLDSACDLQVGQNLCVGEIE
ncbi:hypothetical protein EVJ58_g4618 [Rhodofomes roseus]|uniref:LysM domain-containing protein n=1 Tax=Rhodofomes roseus TaxID=34475 RepID=A0A4Y9YFD1_9APHY|nr:hypothetical protein EVJ58_g4618 [Rhodofomes roseus]